jgi:hypothetical protein
MTVKAIAIAVVLIGLVAGDAAAQRKPVSGTASLSGRVIDRRDQPLQGVTLRLFDYDRRSETKAATDAAGRYSFTGLGGGNYHVLAMYQGYVAQVHGVPELTSASFPTPEGLISIRPGRHVTGIDFQLLKGASIRGRITTPEGLPLAGVTMSSVFVVEPNQVRHIPSAAMSSATTSAMGEFVLEGLSPGLYLVSATPPRPKDTSGSPPSGGFQRTFYPGAPQTDAVAIRVALEDAISGIDFPLLRSDLVNISGQVIRAESDSGIELFAVTAESTRNLGAHADGTFSASGLKPGRYTVWARAKTAYGFEAAWESVDAFAGKRDTNPLRLMAGERVELVIVIERSHASARR